MSSQEKEMFIEEHSKAEVSKDRHLDTNIQPLTSAKLNIHIPCLAKHSGDCHGSPAVFPRGAT